MAVDLLDIDREVPYFEEPLNHEAGYCLDKAAETYGDEQAEVLLMRAYFLEPEHPMVLVGLYRYFYYQHRLEDALLVAERILRVFAMRLELPEDWRDLDDARLGNGVLISMVLVRFYMLALKGAGYLQLRLGEYESALARLQKVVEIDSSDRLGARALLEVAQESLQQHDQSTYAGNGNGR